MSNKSYEILGILTVAGWIMLTAGAYAQDHARQGVPEAMPHGQPYGGVVSGGATAATGAGGDVRYRNLVESGDFFRPLPGYRAYDDIHLESGGSGALLEYSIRVFGSTVCGSQAGSPYDVRTRLYEDTLGDPPRGVPLPAHIPGSECTFEGIPAGASFTLRCKVAPGATIPDGLWLALDFSTDNSGWLLAGTRAQIGRSEHSSVLEDFLGNPGVFAFLDFFVPCPPTCNSMVAEIIVEGQPWACCDVATLGCTNIQETDCDPATSSFAQGTLCNDLDPPCSAAGVLRHCYGAVRGVVRG